jgi:hypothetical protein
MTLLIGLLCEMTLTAAAGMSEVTLLDLYGDMAFRPDSSTLCIITAQGDTLVFSDDTDPEYLEGLVEYTLLSYLQEQNYWVVESMCYEWVEYLLINCNNGFIAYALSSPDPSPDGTRFYCSIDYLGLMENGIQIWRVDPDSLALEFEDLALPWAPINAVWEGDSAIVFEKLSYDSDAGDYITRPGRLELVSDGTWRPDDPADWE